MANIFEALKAAKAMKTEPKAEPKREQPRSASPLGSSKKAAPKSEKPKSEPKKDSPKTKGGASYTITAEFKQAIENHLKGRTDMAEKLNKPGKSIDGCCDYIFDVMRKRAEKARNGKSAVGLYADPNEIFGLAVHYYDESEESLKSELKEK